MSRSRNVVWWLVAVAVTVGLVIAARPVRNALTADPLAKFRTPVGTDLPAVEMRNFRWQAFDGARLVAVANVGRMTTGSDRIEFALSGVKDGTYHVKAGQQFGFEAKSATYRHDTGSLVGRAGARIHDKRLDVSTQSFRYEREGDLLLVPGPTSGRLFDGSVKARKLSYEVGTGRVRALGMVWQGTLSQDAPKPAKRTWRFETPPESESTVRGPVSTFSKITASDGEVIVKADKAEYNRDTDVLVATGNVRYFGIDVNMTSQKAVVYHKERRTVLVGAVDLLVKAKPKDKPEVTVIPPLEPILPQELPPGPPATDDAVKERARQIRSSENLRDYPMAITADQVEYWYAKGQRKAVATGKPQARQQIGPDEWRVVWAHIGTYDAEAETLRLVSRSGERDVRLVNSLGDDMSATWILVSTKEGDDNLSAGALQATMQIDEDEVPKEEGAGKGTTGGGGGSAPSIKGKIGG